MSQRSISTSQLALAALLALGAVSSAHAQRVVRDAQTGELRAPVASEIVVDKARAGAVGLVSGRPNPAPVTLPNGTVMQELTTDSLMYSVARRNADGSISQFCVTGQEAASRIVQGKPAATSRLAKADKSSKGQVYEVK
jgi:hypothetical protein